LVSPETNSTDQIFIEGNGFSGKVQNELFNTVANENGDVVLITYVPGAGFPVAAAYDAADHPDKPNYEISRLLELFERALNVLAPGGIFLIEYSGNADIGNTIQSALSEYLRSESIPFEYKHASGGDASTFKIRKWRPLKTSALQEGEF
jgi:hypothetical protein